MIRVILPFHLQTLAGCEREVTVAVDGAVTVGSVLDALEALYPMLRGTIREHLSLRNRPRIRLFADNKDVTHTAPDTVLPDSVACGEQPLRIVGAVSGG